MPRRVPRIALLAALLASAPAAGADLGSRVLGGPGWDHVLELVAQEPDRLRFASYVSRVMSGPGDLWWLETDLDGRPLREGVLAWDLTSATTAAVVTQDGGLLIGADRLDTDGSSSGLLVKLDASGAIQWQRELVTGGGNDRVRDVRERPGGEILVLGQRWTGTLPDAWLLRLTPDGTPLDAFAIESPEAEWAHGLVPADDGGFLLYGEADPDAFAETDGWAVRLNADLSVRWQVLFGGGNQEVLNHAVARPEGGWLLAGRRSLGDGLVVALDDLGNVEWHGLYGGADSDSFTHVTPLAAGGYAIAGSTRSWGAGGPLDTWLVGIDAVGDVQWQAAYGGSANETAGRVFELADGRLLLSTNSFTWRGLGSWDAWLLFLDPRGDVGPGCTYREPSDAVRGAMAMTTVPSTRVVRALTPVVLDAMLAPVAWTSVHEEQCWGTVVPTPPREVSPPGAATPLRVATGGVITWESASLSGSETFDASRGEVRLLPTSAAADCLAADLGAPTVTDPEPPPPEGWFYLVRGVNAAGEGPLGDDSLGNARGVRTACP